MSNSFIVVVTILIIVIIGHLYIKNMVLNDESNNSNTNNNNSNNNNSNNSKSNNSKSNNSNLNDKKVSFGESTVRLIPDNNTLNDINSITPPTNIKISDTTLESELKNHIDSIYKPDKIIYNEKVYKKDTLSGYSDNTLNSFSEFKSNTDYYPYNTDERKLINKYNKYSSSHFTDDNFDLSSFFDNNQQFNDTTSAFVDNGKYKRVKGELNKSNTLLAPPLINEGEPCQPYNQKIGNKTQAELNKGLISSQVVNVDGQSLESWQYDDENVMNGGNISNGLQGYSGFDDIYSNINNEEALNKCLQ